MKLTFGRSNDRDIVLAVDKESGVSREHGVLIIERGKIYIEDTNSKNGIYVDGKHIHARTPLSASSVVNLGKQYRFNWQRYVDTSVLEDYNDETILTGSSMGDSRPLIDIPSRIEINHNEAEIYRNGEDGADWKVPFKRNMGDRIGEWLGSTLGCLISIGIIVLIIFIICAFAN